MKGKTAYVNPANLKSDNRKHLINRCENTYFEIEARVFQTNHAKSVQSCITQGASHA